MQTLSPEECVRFAYLFGGQKSRQNASPGPECLRGVPAMVAAGSETHSDDSRGRCEIRPASPSPSDRGSLQPPGERPLGESGCCPGARTPVPAVPAAVSAAAPTECRRPRRERGYLY